MFMVTDLFFENCFWKIALINRSVYLLVFLARVMIAPRVFCTPGTYFCHDRQCYVSGGDKIKMIM